MNIAGEMQKCLVTLDVERARQLWRVAFPHLPAIESDGEMLRTLHLARTQSEVLALRLRRYSHQWLLERGLPSGLPESERPKAVRAVGISVNSGSELFRPIVGFVRSAMENAVLEAFADGHAEDDEVVRSRMMEAKQTTVRKLLGVK